MWKCDECAGSRHFERSPPEADEVRNLTEYSDIKIEINNTGTAVFSSDKWHEISHFVRLRRTPFEMTTSGAFIAFPHFHIFTFPHSPYYYFHIYHISTSILNWPLSSGFRHKSLSLPRQVLYDQLLLNPPRAGRQQG